MATKRKPVSKKSTPVPDEEVPVLTFSDDTTSEDVPDVTPEPVDESAETFEYLVLNVDQMNELLNERLLGLEAQHFQIMLQYAEVTTPGSEDEHLAAASKEQMTLLERRIEVLRSLTILPGEDPEASEGE